MRSLTAATVMILSAACGAAVSADSSQPAAPTSEPASGEDALHTALVDAHKKAVEACFGGFGKGAPYSAELTLSDQTVSEAKIDKLSDGHGPLPADCIAKHFKAMAVPPSVDSDTVRARFAVANDDCALPECEKNDMRCLFTRDIRCTVVIDAR